MVLSSGCDCSSHVSTGPCLPPQSEVATLMPEIKRPAPGRQVAQPATCLNDCLAQFALHPSSR